MNLLEKIIFFLILLVATACNLTRHVPQGEYLVSNVEIITDSKNVKSSDLKPYIRQNINHKTFGIIPMQLMIYSMAGQDSTKWRNRFLMKAGSAPELYDSTLTYRTEVEMQKYLSNKGYLAAEVKSDIKYKKKRAEVKYIITCNNPHIIDSLGYFSNTDSLSTILCEEFGNTAIKPGMPLDRSKLEEERVRLTKKARNLGYYDFNKEYINYSADTAANVHLVDLTLNVLPYKDKSNINKSHPRYKIGNVTMITDHDPLNPQTAKFMQKDTVEYNGYKIVYGDKRYISPKTLIRSCYLIPGHYYSDRLVEVTYNAFARLQNLKFVNIIFEPSKTEENTLDCTIQITKGNNQTIRTELEGTNSAGDFGFATAITYQHRNLFKGAEIFTTKVHGGYENLTGNVSNLIKNNYMEYGAEVGISFPRFLFPFISESQRKRIRANTEVKASYDYQQRPEYQRVIAGGAFKYSWFSGYSRYRHTLDFVDINYVYLPYKSDEFINSIINNNPISDSSYSDHLISRTGYSFLKTNQNLNFDKTDVYSFRIATEFAGNILYGASKLLNKNKTNEGYKIGGLQFEQYWKLDIDYSYTRRIDNKNALAFHFASGIGIPYLNSSVMPFEKRYYAGGANSVRGWSVRTLGPGRYNSTTGTLDYFKQCGDIRLDSSIEYRSKLFWKLEMAAFIDAGNVWTFEEYELQPNGGFNIETFYKEIALAYGLGIRFDFNFFVLRFDMGVKAYDPSLIGNDPWVIKRPFEGNTKNMTFHFAVGYPF